MTQATFALALAMLASCGADASEPVATVLTVWNRSQFELIDLRVHPAQSYAAAPNLLASPLPPEASIDVDFVQGYRVTVMRRKVGVGELIALSTATGLREVDAEGYTLIVFDESFRLLEPGVSP